MRVELGGVRWRVRDVTAGAKSPMWEGEIGVRELEGVEV